MCCNVVKRGHFTYILYDTDTYIHEFVKKIEENLSGGFWVYFSREEKIKCDIIIRTIIFL